MNRLVISLLPLLFLSSCNEERGFSKQRKWVTGNGVQMNVALSSGQMVLRGDRFAANSDDGAWMRFEGDASVVLEKNNINLKPGTKSVFMEAEASSIVLRGRGKTIELGGGVRARFSGP
jgi:hypothetical protein